VILSAPVIAVINATATATDLEVFTVASVLQTQIARDVATAWGVGAQLAPVSSGDAPPPGAWWLVIADTPDLANADGYHELTSSGLPLGKAFTQTSTPWSLAASHELIEMLLNPWGNMAVVVQQGQHTQLLAREVCDPCEGLSYAYMIDSVIVSDFVFPLWYEPGATGVLDQTGSAQHPLQLLPGAALSAVEMTTPPHWVVLGPDGPPSGAADKTRDGHIRRGLIRPPRSVLRRSRPQLGRPAHLLR
jgi:hypothetical protein